MNDSNSICYWKSAIDSKSGRTYYYHVITKATTWSKPIELATPTERREMIALKENTIRFFKQMEENIRTKIDNARKRDLEQQSRRFSNNSVDFEDIGGSYYLDLAPSSNSTTHSNSPQPPSHTLTRLLSNDSLANTTTNIYENKSYVHSTTTTNSILKSQSKYNNNNTINTTTNNLEYKDMKNSSMDCYPLHSTNKYLKSSTSREDVFDSDSPGYLRKPTNSYSSNTNSNSSRVVSMPRRIRTISSVDDDILLTMSHIARNNSSNKPKVHYNSALGGNGSNVSINISPISELNILANVAEEKISDNQSFTNSMRAGSKELATRISGRYPVVPQQVELKYLMDHMDISSAPSMRVPPSTELKRRNSTSTIYVANTMSSQDNGSTIECVCVVIRAHMLDAAKENVVPISEYDVFKDAAFVYKSSSAAATLDDDDKNSDTNIAMVPSLNTVKDFFTYLFSKSQLESDCIIMALIYIERLVKETKGKLCIRYDNWRSIVFACLVMASKVWDDLSMWNVDFSQVYPSFNLSRVNELELAMLNVLKYVIRVSASEYAKYYFHLRSMMTKLGLDRENMENQIRPLDIIGARKLQISTEKYSNSIIEPRRRFHSVTDGLYSLESTNKSHRCENFSKDMHVHHPHTPVGLEQLIHEQHMDADGQKHLHNNLKKNSFRDLHNQHNLSNKSISTTTTTNNINSILTKQKNNINDSILQDSKSYK